MARDADADYKKVTHRASLVIIARLDSGEAAAPTVICTSQATEFLSDLGTSFNFAEISLGGDVELLQGVLGRYLRRKMLDLEVSSKLANLEMPEAIQWLLRIYCNLYIFVKTTSQTLSFLSPALFMSCPVDSTAHLRSWFIDLWNSALISQLRHVVATSATGMDCEDPVRFVLQIFFEFWSNIFFVTTSGSCCARGRGRTRRRGCRSRC